nr:MAG TPA: hypothetical protein [Bacteriophage sp.]
MFNSTLYIISSLLVCPFYCILTIFSYFHFSWSG